MAGFETDYADCRIYRYKKGESIWAELLEDQKYTSKSGDEYTVPKGFQTNFASVPRPLWAWFAPFGKYTQAAILHDYFYSGKGVSNRKEADKLFYEAGRSSAMQLISMWIMWFFVRFYAWFAYTSPEGKKGKIDSAGIIGIIMAIIVLGALGFLLLYVLNIPIWKIILSIFV